MEAVPCFFVLTIPWAYLSGAIIRNLLLAPLQMHPDDPSTRWRFTLAELMGLVMLLQLPMGLCGFLHSYSPRTITAPILLGGLLTAALAWRVGQQTLARSDVPPGLRRFTLLTVAIPLGLLTALAAPMLGVIAFIEMATIPPDGAAVAFVVTFSIFIADLTLLFFCTAAVQGGVDQARRRRLY